MACGLKGAAEPKAVLPVPKPRVFHPNNIGPARTMAFDASRFQESPSRKTPANGCYRGLLTGFLISALLGAALLLSTHRRQIGELFIQLGERFGANANIQTVSPPSQPRVP